MGIGFNKLAFRQELEPGAGGVTPDLEGIGAGTEGDEGQFVQVPADQWEAIQQTSSWVEEQRQIYEEQQAEAERQARDQELAGTIDAFADPEDQLETYRRIAREEAQQLYAPMQTIAEQVQRDEIENLTADMIHNAELDQGEFLFPDDDAETGAVGSRTLTRELAEAYLPEAMQRYGGGHRAVEAAIGEAYKAVRAYEDQIGQRYFERRQNELRGLRQAPAPPARVDGAAAPQVLTTHDAADERDLVSQFFPITGR